MEGEHCPSADRTAFGTFFSDPPQGYSNGQHVAFGDLSGRGLVQSLITQSVRVACHGTV